MSDDMVLLFLFCAILSAVLASLGFIAEWLTDHPDNAIVRRLNKFFHSLGN